MQTDRTATIPDDLVPLRTIAGRLAVPIRDLVKLAEQCAFPRVHRVGRRLRVSQSAVERWWRETDVAVLAGRRAAADVGIRGRR